MQLNIVEATRDLIRAQYACPCGCQPSVEYPRNAGVVREGCCCGNELAVGPHAAVNLVPREGFRPELQAFDAPWGERLEAAWLVGPSLHELEHHDHDDRERDGSDGGTPGQAVDPVCGMTVDEKAARTNGLHINFGGRDFFFCGKGCKLEFGDDPERFLDPSYVPSM